MVVASRAELAARDAELRNRDLLIEKLRHQPAGLRRQRFGTASETLDQLELGLEDEEIARAAEVLPEPPPAGRSSRSAVPCPIICRAGRPFSRRAIAAPPVAAVSSGSARTSPRSWISMPPRARRSPPRRWNGSRRSTPSRRRPAGSRPSAVSRSAGPGPGRASTTWSAGCKCSCRRSPPRPRCGRIARPDEPSSRRARQCGTVAQDPERIPLDSARPVLDAAVRETRRQDLLGPWYVPPTAPFGISPPCLVGPASRPLLQSLEYDHPGATVTGSTVYRDRPPGRRGPRNAGELGQGRQRVANECLRLHVAPVQIWTVLRGHRPR